jgi:hypothetical protein
VSHDDCYDWGKIARNKHIISVRTLRGGHLGWFDGLFPGWSTTTFSDRIVVDFLSAVLEQHAQTNFLTGVMKKMTAHADPSADGSFTPGQFARIVSSADLEVPTAERRRPRRNSFTAATNLAANLGFPDRAVKTKQHARGDESARADGGPGRYSTMNHGHEEEEDDNDTFYINGGSDSSDF